MQWCQVQPLCLIWFSFLHDSTLPLSGEWTPLRQPTVVAMKDKKHRQRKIFCYFPTKPLGKTWNSITNVLVAVCESRKVKPDSERSLAFVPNKPQERQQCRCSLGVPQQCKWKFLTEHSPTQTEDSLDLFPLRKRSPIQRSYLFQETNKSLYLLPFFSFSKRSPGLGRSLFYTCLAQQEFSRYLSKAKMRNNPGQTLQ